MCPPKFFGIEYEINSWMHTENDVNQDVATKQWDDLYNIYTQKLAWNVDLIEPIKGLPDMVFATDCCLIKDGKILLSNFRYPERQPETQYFEKWLHANGFTNTQHAQNRFEGGSATRTISSQQGNQFTFAYLKVNAMQDMRFAIPRMHVLHFE